VTPSRHCGEIEGVVGEAGAVVTSNGTEIEWSCKSSGGRRDGDK
jgi:hypothetical protein